MKIINVSLKTNPYKIIVGKKILGKLGSHLKRLKVGKDAIVITNPIIKKYHGSKLIASLKRSGFTVKVFEVPDGEKSKSAKVAFQLIEKIAAYDVMKDPFVVALGGGVIGDLAGYVAAAYKRGIPYIQVPTTFLAQIDSAIGGKVAIDLPVGKNLVGAFYQPKVVYSDVDVLATLSKRQIRNGLAEAIKYGVIYNATLFSFIEKHYSSLIDANTKTLMEVVLSCSRIKRTVVVEDEKETKGIRTILNYGHTVGHAIEAAAGFHHYQHGEAIALGMRIAADIAHQKRMFAKKDVDRQNALLSAVGLPQEITKVKMLDVLRLMKHDKKFRAGKNRFVLATKIGRVKVVENVAMEVIKKAIKRNMQ